MHRQQTVCAVCGLADGHSPRCSVTKFGIEEIRVAADRLRAGVEELAVLRERLRTRRIELGIEEDTRMGHVEHSAYQEALQRSQTTARRPRFTADELLVLQRAMAGVFLDEDAYLRDGILRRLVKAENEARRSYAR
jgi:hypothetical protein